MTHRKHEAGNHISPIIVFHLIKTVHLIGDLLQLKGTRMLRGFALPCLNLLSFISQFLVVFNLMQCVKAQVHNKTAHLAMTEVGQRSYLLRIEAKVLQVKKKKSKQYKELK